MVQLFSQPAVFGASGLLLAVIAVIFLVSRRRRMSSSVDDAVMEALQRMSKAAPDLREGLTQEAADKATPHLREMLRCVAVGITDADGTMLSWDGEAAYHYQDMIPAISKALDGHRRELFKHDAIEHCGRGNRCAMRSAVIVPLIVEGEDVGALVVVAGPDGGRLFRMADEIASFVCTQLELARLEESKQQLAQAEVRALRAQISPHFLFNVLNTISSLIRTDPERARELLLEFAQFTRYCLRTSTMYTTLAEELRNIDRYLLLESVRYGPRVNVRLKIAPEVLPVVVPFLVLQPLVENAVKHGLVPKPGGGTVTVIARDNGAEALISVEDDGVGMDPDRLTAELANAHRTGAHIGIGNINQRMRMAFGNEYALMLETAVGEGMKVTLRVPKYTRGVRPGLPDYATQSDDEADALHSADSPADTAAPYPSG